MTPSERLHKLHESRARRITIEPRTPSIVPALQGIVRDLASIGAIALFLLTLAVWAV